MAIIIPKVENPSWAKFYALPFDIRDAVERFWEPGYDYSDPEFWNSFVNPDPEFVEAVIMYDMLQEV